MKEFKLKHPKQCSTCPWKQSTTVEDIPMYSRRLHLDLADTIAKTNLLKRTSTMACHHSEPGEDRHCIDWLHNQLGVGNNILLRLQFMKCINADEIETGGEQVSTFEETFK